MFLCTILASHRDTGRIENPHRWTVGLTADIRSAAQFTCHAGQVMRGLLIGDIYQIKLSSQER